MTGDIIHLSPLYPSPQAMVLMVKALYPRFLEVCAIYQRVHGEELVPPPELDADMKLWRLMVARFKKGDYRNTQDEDLATARVAQWTLDMKMDLCGQERIQVDWGGRV
jgi:hypothetical protein